MTDIPLGTNALVSGKRLRAAVHEHVITQLLTHSPLV